MKKILAGTSALVAVGAIASAAQAAEPIKLSVGGFMNQWVAVGDIDSYTYNGTAAGAGANRTTREYGNVALWSDTEVQFSGSTVLDNGLKVAVQINMEAERTSSSTARNVDQQFVTLSGGWGQVRIGEMKNAATIVHNQAPVAGASADDAAGIFPGSVPNGATVNTLTNHTTTVDGIADAGANSVGIDYISPMFGPFAFGITYTPNVTSRGFAQESNSVNDLMGVALVYADKWGPVGVKADVAYARFDHDGSMGRNGTLTNGANGVVHGLPIGLNLSYAGFEVGGSYFRIMDSMKYGQNQANAAGSSGLGLDGTAWDAGIAYTTGNWKFAYSFYSSNLTGDGNDPRKDKERVHIGGGEYTMGPGVVVTANVAYQTLKDETTTTVGNKQESLALITGLKLTF